MVNDGINLRRSQSMGYAAMATMHDRTITPREHKEDRRRGFFWWWNGALQGRLAALGLAALIGGMAYLAWLNPQFRYGEVAAPEQIANTPSDPATPAVTVATEQRGDATVFPIDGLDSAGRRVFFDVLVLSKDYNWVRGSALEIAKGSETLTPDAVQSTIFSEPVRWGLTNASDVIAVGAASQEGQATAELERANQRSRTSAAWLEAFVSPTTAIWLLNLGQFKNPCGAVTETADTSFQRPLMMVAVRAKDTLDANLGEALANAIAGKANLPSRECYTNFDLAKFR